MSEQPSASFIVCLWILTVCLSPEVRGQLRVIGASEPVIAHVGGDVTLPCHCNPTADLTPLTVEWSRAELRPHPSDPLKRVRYVHLYTDHRDDDTDMKILEFTNRTQLFPDQFSRGVASLRIRNVALSDNGTYKCFIPSLQTKKSLKWTHVTLIVDAPDLVPRSNDSNIDGHPKAPTARSAVPKIVISFIFSALLILMVVLLRIQRKKKDDDLLQKTKLQEKGESVAVRVEDVTLLVPQQS